MPERGNNTINHFPQVFGVSYAYRDKKCFGNRLHAVPPSLPRGGDGKAVGSGCSRRCHGYKNGYSLTPCSVPHLSSSWLPVKWERWMRWSWKVLQDHILHTVKKSQEKLGGPGVHLQNQHIRTNTQSAGKETGLGLSKTHDSDSPQRGGKLRGGKSQLLRAVFTKNSADWE